MMRGLGIHVSIYNARHFYGRQVRHITWCHQVTSMESVHFFWQEELEAHGENLHEPKPTR